MVAKKPILERFISMNRINTEIKYEYLLFVMPLVSVFVWLVFFYNSEMGMRGFDMTVINGNDYYDSLARLCPGMPSCLRVGAGLLKLGLKFLIEIPFVLFKVPYVEGQINAISGFATSFITLSSAIFFLYRKDYVISTILMSMLFIFTPMFLEVKIGLVHYDYTVLLFWGVVTTYFLPTTSNKFSVYAIYCVIGSLVMENTGIALWIGLLLFYIVKNFSNIKGAMILKYLFILIFPVLAVLLVYFGAYLNNSNNLHWIREGGSFILTYQMYGINNSFPQIFYCLVKMIWLPLLGILLLFLHKIYFFRNINLLIKENLNLLWSLCCFAGFLSTLIVGKFVSGLSMEWPRQMMPATYLLTMVLINLFTVLVGQKNEVTVK